MLKKLPRIPHRRNPISLAQHVFLCLHPGQSAQMLPRIKNWAQILAIHRPKYSMFSILQNVSYMRHIVLISTEGFTYRT